MRKAEIQKKNIVVDLSPEEFNVNAAAIGFILEMLTMQPGFEDRAPRYVEYITSHKNDAISLGLRMQDTMVALKAGAKV